MLAALGLTLLIWLIGNLQVLGNGAARIWRLGATRQKDCRSSKKSLCLWSAELNRRPQFADDDILGNWRASAWILGVGDTMRVALWGDALVV